MEDLYLRRPKLMLKFLGLWATEEPRKLKTKLLISFILFSQYSFLLLEVVYVVQVWGDIEATSEATYLFFTQANLCYKMSSFAIKLSSLTTLLRLMDDDVFKPEDDTQKKIMGDFAAKINWICLYFLISTILTCSLWSIVPLFDSSSLSLPFLMWMPFPTNVSPLYELAYLYQVSGIFISAYLFNSIDNVVLAMIMFSCSQILIVREKILNLTPSAQSKTSSIIKKGDNYTRLSRCVHHHQAIVQFTEQMEDAYNMNIFLQVSGSVGIVCISGLRITIVEWHSVQFFSMLTYLFAMLLQLHTYCWCGHELSIASDKLRQVLYVCPWYEESLQFRRSLWIMMERMKRPLIFRAGKYIPLSLQTFVSILRSSYSFFALLQNVRAK